MILNVCLSQQIQSCQFDKLFRVKKPTLLESVCFPSYLCGPCLNPKPGVKCGPSFHVTVSHALRFANKNSLYKNYHSKIHTWNRSSVQKAAPVDRPLWISIYNFMYLSSLISIRGPLTKPTKPTP